MYRCVQEIRYCFSCFRRCEKHREFIDYTDSTVESPSREICTLGDPFDETSVNFLFLSTASESRNRSRSLGHLNFIFGWASYVFKYTHICSYKCMCSTNSFGLLLGFVRNTRWYLVLLGQLCLNVNTVHHCSYCAFVYAPLISLLDCLVIFFGGQDLRFYTFRSLLRATLEPFPMLIFYWLCCHLIITETSVGRDKSCRKSY